MRAPAPPFPPGAWFVVFGDANGSLVEILPADFVFDPDALLGLRQRRPTFEPVTAHVLIRAALNAEAIDAVARREGWRMQQVETGLFKVIKLWIDGNVLVELLTSKESERYAAAFGERGMAVLDGKLRDLEARMAAALAR